MDMDNSQDRDEKEEPGIKVRTGVPIIDFCLHVMEEVHRGDPDWREGDQFDYKIIKLTPVPKKDQNKKKAKKKKKK